jgi:hypothetical protein
LDLDIFWVWILDFLDFWIFLGLDFGFFGFLDFWIFFGFWVSHPNPIQKPKFFWARTSEIKANCQTFVKDVLKYAANIGNGKALLTSILDLGTVFNLIL